jgi:hypothetical protein
MSLHLATVFAKLKAVSFPLEFQVTDVLILLAMLIVPPLSALAINGVIRASVAATVALVAWVFFVSWFERNADAMSVWNMWFISAPTTAFYAFVWSCCVVWIIQKVKQLWSKDPPKTD